MYMPTYYRGINLVSFGLRRLLGIPCSNCNCFFDFFVLLESGVLENYLFDDKIVFTLSTDFEKNC